MNALARNPSECDEPNGENMIRRFRTVVLCFILAALQISLSMAQSKPAPTPTAPIPPQILAAKKVFIANAGGDEMANYDPRFSGSPDRAYSEFYAAVKSWGRFEIVTSPAEADLVLEVRQSVSGGTVSGPGSSLFIPEFRLKVRDARTNALLWGFNIRGAFGLGQAESDRNFDQAINRLVTRFQTLVTPPAAAGVGP
jgi:hypothetical protein